MTTRRRETREERRGEEDGTSRLETDDDRQSKARKASRITAVPNMNRLLGLCLGALLAACLSCRQVGATATCAPYKRPSAAIASSTAAIAASMLPRGGAAGGGKLAKRPGAVAAGPNFLASFFRTVYKARSHLAAAAIARAISIFGMFPVDTIKTRIQVKNASPFRIEGLYKGVGGSLAGQVPYGVLTFGSYEIYKSALISRFPEVRPAFIYALAAILGDVTGSGWLCPSEVMKQQVQAGIYPSMSEAVKGIWQKSGVAGYWQGFFAGLSRDVPFRVAQLTTFEVTKSIYLRAKQSTSLGEGEVTISAVEAAICGAISGSFSAAITTPLDRIKTILMTDTSGAYGGSVVSCASKIIKEDGLPGLFKGIVPRVVYIAPSVCIFFVAYEVAKQKLSVEK